ncbi:MAG: histidine phosphatase family protein [Anaerolineae bacterium]|nr:histidine phosphatase family protein [Anaerolineae bacterium]
MNVTILRHGQTVGNATGDYSTTANDVLSVYGYEQAERLIEGLAGYQFDVIYCSPLERALKTIAPYLRENGRSAEIWPELAEACWQADLTAPIPLRSNSARPIIIEEQVAGLFTLLAGHTALPYDDEVFQEGFARIDRAHERLLARHSDTTDSVLVVCHGYLASRLIERFLEMPRSDDNRFSHDNTAVSFLEQLPNGVFRLQYLNKLLI